MPTYEYECSKGHTFEAVQRITEDPLKRCKVCRSKVRRLIQAPNFILKGGGWYSDGYGSAKPSSSKGGGDASSSSNDSGSSGDSSSKSADSGDAKSSSSD